MNLKEFGSGRRPFSHETVNMVAEIRITARRTTCRQRIATCLSHMSRAVLFRKQITGFAPSRYDDRLVDRQALLEEIARMHVKQPLICDMRRISRSTSFFASPEWAT
jgi:hypothetical protein